MTTRADLINKIVEKVKIKLEIDWTEDDAKITELVSSSVINFNLKGIPLLQEDDELFDMYCNAIADFVAPDIKDDYNLSQYFQRRNTMDITTLAMACKGRPKIEVTPHE